MKIAILLALMLFTSLVYASPGVTYYHTDRQGSPIIATDESAKVIWRAHYRPFGERTQNLNYYLDALENPVWFAGHVEDDRTSLSYMQARYYHPLLGRFLSVDPAPVSVERSASFNRYAYAYNNPYRYTDPDGREALLISVKGTGAAGAGISAGTGIYLTFPLRDTTPLDIGLFNTAAVVAGADVSATLNVSMMRGGRDEIEGAQITTSATLPLTGAAGPAVDLEYMIDPVTGESSGAALGIGLAAFPNASAASGASFVTFSLRDTIDALAGPEPPDTDPVGLWFEHIAM